MGSQVLSEEPKTGKAEAEAIQAVWPDPVRPSVEVDFTDGSSIKATADHPFYVEAGGRRAAAGWVQAGQLLAGDRLRTADGKDVTVAGVRYDAGRAVVYTLTVAKDHTFFVGSAAVLVHNTNWLCPTKADN